MPEIRPAVHCSQDVRRFDQTWFVLLGKMLCDDNDDGIVDIDLHTLDTLVTNGNTAFATTYFTNAADAETNANEISFFTNTNATETLFARIENIATGCHTVNSFNIEVIGSDLQPN